jgi:hypothetical protein
MHARRGGRESNCACALACLQPQPRRALLQRPEPAARQRRFASTRTPSGCFRTARSPFAVIVVDWTMVGSERMPIESVLCGAVLLTGANHCGQDADDFPIPRRNVLRHPHNLSEAIPRILGDFGREQHSLKLMRHKYRALGARSLRREAADFLNAHAATAGVRKYKAVYAPAVSTEEVLQRAVAVADEARAALSRRKAMRTPA